MRIGSNCKSKICTAKVTRIAYDVSKVGLLEISLAEGCPTHFCVSKADLIEVNSVKVDHLKLSKYIKLFEKQM